MQIKHRETIYGLRCETPGPIFTALRKSYCRAKYQLRSYIISVVLKPQLILMVI